MQREPHSTGAEELTGSPAKIPHHPRHAENQKRQVRKREAGMTKEMQRKDLAGVPARHNFVREKKKRGNLSMASSCLESLYRTASMHLRRCRRSGEPVCEAQPAGGSPRPEKERKGRKDNTFMVPLPPSLSPLFPLTLPLCYA